MWWVIASEIVIFGGLLGSYLMHRIGHPEWAHQAIHTNTWAGAFNTLVLLTSSLCAVLAHQAAERRTARRRRELPDVHLPGRPRPSSSSRASSGPTRSSEGFTITSNMFWSFYYTAAGLHGLHVLAGMIIMLFVAADARKNQELQRVENIGIYWHFVDIVWIFLFPLLYIAK